MQSVSRAALFLLTAILPSQAIACEDECAIEYTEKDGTVWARSCDWPASAQAADWDTISAWIDAGFLVKIPDTCFSMTFADATVCVITVDGVEILARPSDEIGPVALNVCPNAAPWVVGMSSQGQCWALSGDMAFRVEF